MFAKQEKVQRQVASLTKIMTSVVVLDLIDKYNLDIDSVRVNVLTSSTTKILGGTSAELIAGDKLTVRQLLYGMMLPSGNDAAQSLAIFFGNLVNKMKNSQASKFNTLSVQDCNVCDENYAEDEIAQDVQEDLKGDAQDNVNDNEKMNNDDEVIQPRSNSTRE